MRALPHRLSSGRCRECGMYSAYSAPKTCARCSLELAADRGHRIEVDPVRRFESYADELWQRVAADMRSGAIRSDHFYTYVGHNDGGPLAPPLADESPSGFGFGDAPTAMQMAQDLQERYPQVWIVTSVGCWEAAAPSTTEGAQS